MAVLFEFMSALFWGISGGIIITILIVYVIKKIFSVSGIYPVVISIFLFLFLSFQLVALTSAIKVKGYVKKTEVLSDMVNVKTGWVEIENNYPVLRPYLKDIKKELKADAITEVSMASVITDVINGYLWRRAGWIVCIIVITFILGGILDTIHKPARRRSYGMNRQNTPSRRRNMHISRKF